MTVRVLLVEADPVYRAGLGAVFAGADDVRVVGEADTAQRAVERAAEVAADVVVVDVDAPERDGLEAVRALVRHHPEAAVLVLTRRDRDQMLVAALRAGARGYLVKGADRQEVLATVRMVHRGGLVVGSHLVARLTLLLADGAAGGPAGPFPNLTVRQREILNLLARGYDNRRLARELVLSEKTVRNHVSAILTGLGVASRVEAALLARNAGLGTD